MENLTNAKIFVEKVLTAYCGNSKIAIPATNAEKIKFFKGLIPAYTAGLNSTVLSRYSSFFDEYLKIGVESKIGKSRKIYKELLDDLKAFKRFVVKSNLLDYSDCVLFNEYNTEHNQKMVKLISSKKWLLDRYNRIEFNATSYVRGKKEVIVKLGSDCKEITDLLDVALMSNGNIKLSGKHGSFQVRNKALLEKVMPLLNSAVNLKISFDNYKVVKQVEIV